MFRRFRIRIFLALRRRSARTELHRSCILVSHHRATNFLYCDWRKTSLHFQIHAIQGVLFLLSAPYYLFYATNRGFEKSAIHDHNGKFIESFHHYQRSRNVSLLIAALAAFGWMAQLLLSSTSLIPFRTRATVNAVDTFTVCASGCAYTQIQDAINAADSDGDIVQIQDGNYDQPQLLISSSDPKVILRGNVSVVEGLLNGDPAYGLDDGVTINGMWDDPNSGPGLEYHGRLLRVQNNSTIEGIIFKGGGSNDAGNLHLGGAIYVDGSSPTIRTIYAYSGFIAGAQTQWLYVGGALYIRAGSPTVEQFDFNTNVTWSGGGGIFIDGENNASYQPIIRNGTIHDNSANRPDTGAEGNTGGGGLYLYNGKATITNIIFSQNEASRSRGAHLICRNCLNGTSITQNVFKNGKALWGGGIYVTGGTTHSNEIVIENNLITGVESTGGDGGGIYVLGNNNNATIRNNTLDGNIIPLSGSPCPCGANLSYVGDGSPVIQNNIFSNGSGGSGVYLDGPAASNIDDNLFYANAQGVYTGDLTSLQAHDVQGDPKFVNRSSLDFRINATSPAIDVGSSTNAPAIDREGTTRPQGSGIDIGSDEMSLAIGNIYVDSVAGNDTTGTGSIMAPWKTLTMALHNIRGGADEDIVWAASGTNATAFNETLSLNAQHSGAENSPTTFRPWTDGGRSAPILDASGKTSAWTFDNVRHVTVQGFIIQNAQDHGIKISGGEDITIQQSTIHANDQLDDDVGSGILGLNTADLHVFNNYITKNAHGITLANSTNAQIYFNTIDHQTRNGVDLLGTSTAAVVLNNAISANGQVGLRVVESAQASFQSNHNLFYENETLGMWNEIPQTSLEGWQNTSGGDALSVAGDPKYSNSDGNDFSLTLLSAAVNAGALVANLTTDRLSNTRPFDQSAPDIGATEFQFAVGNVYAHAGDGNDESGKGTTSAPWKTLAKALQYVRANRGDTIQAAGTFRETATFEASHAGTRLSRTTLQAWEEQDPFIMDGERVRNQGLVLRAPGIRLHNIEVRNALQDGVLLQDAADTLIERLQIHDHGDDGLELSSSDRAEITNSILSANAGQGIHAVNSPNLRIINDTLVDHQGSAISLTQSPSGVIQNNILTQSQQWVIELDSDSGVAIALDYNNLNSANEKIGKKGNETFSSLTAWQTQGWDAHSISEPSKFINTGDRNYHLTNESPEIDLGVADNAPSIDLDGQTRPQGTGIDLGADETSATKRDAIYIDAKVGNDATGEGSETQPFQSLSKGLSHLRSGGGSTIYATGTFTEEVQLTSDHRGNAKRPTTITTWPSRSRPVLDAKNRNTGLSFNEASYVVFSSFEVANAKKDGVVADDPSAHLTFDQLLLTGNQKSAMTLNGPSDVLIKNSVFHHNGTNEEHNGGLLIQAGSSNVTVVHNLFANNLQSGIEVSEAAPAANGVHFENNIYSDNTIHLIVPKNLSGITRSDYQLLAESESIVGRASKENLTDLISWQQRTSFDAHSIASKPSLVNTAEASFDPHLKNISPAIDAGSILDGIAATQDLDATPRPYDQSQPDLGPDEANYPAVPQNIKSSNVKSTSLTLEWTIAYGSPASFTTEVTTGEDKSITHVSRDNPTTLASLQPATAYTLRVKATNTAGDSNWSVPVTITTLNNDGTPTEDEQPDDEKAEEEGETPAAPEPSTVYVPTLFQPKPWLTTIDASLPIVGLAQSGATVEIFIDEVPNGSIAPSVHSSGIGNFSYRPFVPLLPGQHSVKARAVTSKSSSDFTASITYFTFSPSIQEVLLLDSELFRARKVNSTSHQNPLFVGRGQSNSQLELWIDGTLDQRILLRDHPSNTSSFAIRPTHHLAYGIHSAKFVTVSAENKILTASDRFVFRIVHPLPAPTLIGTFLEPFKKIITGVSYKDTMIEFYLNQQLIGETASQEQRETTANFFFELEDDQTGTLHTRSRDDNDPFFRKSRDSETLKLP